MIGVFSAFVLFAMVWAMVFLIGLQIGHDTQGDRGEIVPGTHAGSPAEFRLGRRAFWTTIVTLAIWGPLVWVIVSGTIGIEDLRAITRGPPPPA